MTPAQRLAALEDVLTSLQHLLRAVMTTDGDAHVRAAEARTLAVLASLRADVEAAPPAPTGAPADLMALVLELQAETCEPHPAGISPCLRKVLAWHPAAPALPPDTRRAEAIEAGRRNFEELRAQMSPESQARATAETEHLVAALPPVEADTCSECGGKGKVLDAPSYGDCHTYMADCEECGGTGRRPTPQIAPVEADTMPTIEVGDWVLDQGDAQPCVVRADNVDWWNEVLAAGLPREVRRTPLWRRPSPQTDT